MEARPCLVDAETVGLDLAASLIFAAVHAFDLGRLACSHVSIAG